MLELCSEKWNFVERNGTFQEDIKRPKDKLRAPAGKVQPPFCGSGKLLLPLLQEIALRFWAVSFQFIHWHPEITSNLSSNQINFTIFVFLTSKHDDQSLFRILWRYSILGTRFISSPPQPELKIEPSTFAVPCLSVIWVVKQMIITETYYRDHLDGQLTTNSPGTQVLCSNQVHFTISFFLLIKWNENAPLGVLWLKKCYMPPPKGQRWGTQLQDWTTRHFPAPLSQFHHPTSRSKWVGETD